MRSMEKLLIPVGTRIKFTKTMRRAACEDAPEQVFAYVGEHGAIVGHGTKEGYWAVTDAWPNEFGVSDEEFDVLD